MSAIARLCAVYLYANTPQKFFDEMFGWGASAMSHLPIAELANRAGDKPNHLPPMSLPEPSAASIDAYRSLGAMTLLDIASPRGQSQPTIEQFYGCLLSHMQKQTAFVALDDSRKPVGYATWLDDENGATITRQSAPFGNHLQLQSVLKQRLGQEKASYISSSARREQVAW